MRPRMQAQPSSSDPGPHLARSKTCELAAIAQVEEKDRFQEAPFLWRPPRKVPWQHITLSLRGPVLWIKKPLKDDFSPFFELINVSNVYMKKEVTTMRPPAPPSSSSTGAVSTLRRNTLKGAPAAAEMEEAKGKDGHNEHEQKEIEAVEATKDNNNNVEVPDVPKQEEQNPADEGEDDKDEDENVDFTKKKKKSKKAKKERREKAQAQVEEGEGADKPPKKVDEPPAAVVAEEAMKEKDEKPEKGQEGGQDENNNSDNNKKEEDNNKKLAKTTSIKFGTVIRWANRGSLIVRPAGPPPDAVAYHSFVVEVRRKEFTLDVIPHTFACPDRAQAESWVTALQEAVIAARLERKRELEVEAGWLPSPRGKMGNPSPERDDESSTDKNKHKEEEEAEEGNKELPEGTDATATTTTTTTTATTTITAGLMAPSMAGGLMTGMFAALPGETEKQWQRRRKQELQEELRERKRRGKAEAKLNLFGLAGTKGYPLEEHKVTTVDGYILTLYRIPHGRCETGFSKRPVVFLMHGLMDCSATWMINEPNKSLAFIFADNGFDVWMGNNRGNRFSREHTTLKVDSSQYWNFNRDDLVKDVRASIDYALDYTQQPHLVYAGHSQGCNLFLAMMSSLPEMRHKVSIGLLVAPAAFVHNQKSKMMTYLANMQTDRLFQFLGIKAFLATGSWLNNITPGLLLYSPQSVRLVTRIMFDYMCGWNPDNNFSLERLPVIAAHQPGGTSVMVMAHWAQSIRNHTFSRFDFGPKKNLEVYQQEQAPPYDMSAVRDVKVAVFYGGEDKLTCKEDVEHLISLLPEETVTYVQYEHEYGHLDFVWGDDAHIRIYQKMVELAREHYRRAEAERPQQEEKEVGEEDETEEATASSSLTSSLSSSCSIEVVRTKEDAAEKDEPKSKLRRRKTDGLVKTKTKKKKATLRKGSKAADVKDEDEVEDENERRHSVDGKAEAKNKKKNTLRRLLRLESHGGLEEAVDLRQDLSDA